MKRHLPELSRFLKQRPFPHLEDRELLKEFIACRHSNRQRASELFSALVSRYGEQVLRRCRARVGDVQHAEDLFQEVFGDLARQADQIKDVAGLGGWLRRVTLRKISRFLKRNSWWKKVLPLGDDQPHDAVVDKSVLEIEHLEKSLGGLHPSYGQPLRLLLVEGCSYAEIAQRMNLPVHTVRTRLQRGRILLQRRWARLAGVGTALLTPELIARAVQVALQPQLTLNAMIVAAVLFVLGGISLAWSVWPEQALRTAEPISTRLVEETLPQKNLRLFHRDIKPEVIQALQTLVKLGKCTLVDVIAEGSWIMATFDLDWGRLGLHSRVRFHFDVHSRISDTFCDPLARNEWEPLSVDSPFVFIIDWPVDLLKIEIHLRGLPEAEAAFRRLPMDDRAMAAASLVAEEYQRTGGSLFPFPNAHRLLFGSGGRLWCFSSPNLLLYVEVGLGKWSCVGALHKGVNGSLPTAGSRYLFAKPMGSDQWHQRLALPLAHPWEPMPEHGPEVAVGEYNGLHYFVQVPAGANQPALLWWRSSAGGPRLGQHSYQTGGSWERYSIVDGYWLRWSGDAVRYEVKEMSDLNGSWLRLVPEKREQSVAIARGFFVHAEDEKTIRYRPCSHRPLDDPGGWIQGWPK